MNPVPGGNPGNERGVDKGGNPVTPGRFTMLGRAAGGCTPTNNDKIICILCIKSDEEICFLQI